MELHTRSLHNVPSATIEQWVEEGRLQYNEINGEIGIPYQVILLHIAAFNIELNSHGSSEPKAKNFTTISDNFIHFTHIPIRTTVFI